MEEEVHEYIQVSRQVNEEAGKIPLPYYYIQLSG